MKPKLLLLLICTIISAHCFYAQSAQKEMSGCMPGNASNAKKLDINHIEATILTGGDMHWNLSGFRYMYPAGSSQYCSGPAGLWIGGFVNSALRTACQTYRQNGNDFWPGPLDPVTVDVSSSDCMAYDKIWKTDYSTINDFIAHFNNGTIQSGTYPLDPTIQSWPAGNNDLAPYVDVNGNGVYDPQMGGDYPAIKGDQGMFYVFNDKGNTHTQTGSPSGIGLQINAMPYAYGCPAVVAGRPELLNTTFYHYRIINHSNNAMTNTYIGVWVDVSIGDGSDDFVGTNPKLGYAFGYNGDNNDNVYGAYAPAVGTVILKAPLVGFSDAMDNDLDSLVDEPGEEYLIPNMYYFMSTQIVSGQTNSVTGDPANYIKYYGYLTGKWQDGTPISCGGNGYPTGTEPAVKHVFPGLNSIDTACNSNWTEITAGNTPGNRSCLLSMGPFTFAAGDTTEIEFAFVTSIDSTQPGNSLASVQKLESDMQKVKQFYSLANKPTCINATGLTEISDNKELQLYPNPNEGRVTVRSMYNYRVPAKVTNLLGETILNDLLLSQGENTIDLGNAAAGIYFLDVETVNGIARYKVLKK